MKLSDEMEKRLTDEIRFVLKNMRNTTVAAQKWYFFSALHGMALRILNLEYEPQLAFAYNVLQFVHGTVNARIAAVATGQEMGVTVPENLLAKIEDELEKMLESIEKKKDICPSLQRLTNLAYSTTGNGYYLYLKGMLKV